MYIAKGVAR